MTLGNDREAMNVALNMIGLTSPHKARVIRIKNTLELTELEVSESLLEEVKQNSNLTWTREFHEMGFDASGNLLPMQ